ncbi:MAG: VWA domain-containing protein [Gammaproteobacteria bacterium]|nr:VWA domain-containing protein [Gammaproteobacteria bacterium]NND36563.1 VWA domain-containing protein [Gammaproteobacteria bacterium]
MLAANGANALQADVGFYETEPNDKPADFHRIQGEITLYGNMVGQDQDGYLWTVTDDDARKRWTFSLNGEPGALTIAQVVRLEYADNGVDVASKRTLLKMGTRDGATPAVHEDLFFEPGEYVIGLAQAGAGRAEKKGGFRPPMATLSFGEDDSEDAGGEAANADSAGTSPPPPNAQPGAYRLVITESKKLTPTPNPKGRDSQTSAHKLRLRGAFSTFESSETSWYKFSFSEQDAAARWDIRVQAPIGRDLRARLVDDDGTELLRGTVGDKGKLRFPDLAPTAGTTWFIELTTKDPGFIHVVSTEAVGQRIAGEEVEPNNNYNFANRVDFAQPVTGRIGGDDAADHFLFTANESTGDELRTLRIETDPPTRLQICLKNPQWGPVQCRNADAPVELPDLALDAGDWGITVDRPGVETTYTMSLASQGPVQAGREVEPNDRIEHAKGIPDKLRIKGRFAGRDTDYYEILVAEAAQLWRFQVIGDNLFELGYYDGSRQQKAKVRATPGNRRMRLDNVFLLPGRHYIRVAGLNDGDYTLLARALGPPDPDGEMEPNDGSNKQRLAIGQTRTGVSADENDQDYYRFFVANWDHLRLTFTPPVDGTVAPNVYWYDGMIGQGMPSTPGEPMIMQGLFPPGDYHVVLDPRKVSEAEYTLQLERLPRWSCPADCEPNGQGLIWLAAPLPPDLVLQGNSGEWRDSDYYQLPAFEQTTELNIRSAGSLRLALGTRVSDQQWLTFDKEFGGYKTTVPAGEPYRLIIESRGKPYRLELEFPNGELEPVTGSLPAELDLSLDHMAVSAFRIQGQGVPGTLKLRNAGTATLDARLEVVTSDHRWTVQLDAERISVPAGGEKTVPIELIAPDDAWAERPVRISARAVDGSRRQIETWTEIAVERDIAPVNPVLFWSMPEPLRGGINAAWLPIGATWTEDTPKWAKRTDNLRDDLVFDGVRLTDGAVTGGWQAGEHPELTIELPGEDPVPVAGMAVNHFGTPGPFFDIREGTLLLSLDGVEFTEALRFEALPVETEQPFALEQPVAARFARLRIDSTFRERSAERASMAEWKVILEPGYDPSGGKGYNIADPSLGAHLAWDWPPEPYSPRRVLTPGDASKAAGMQRGDIKQYVIAFKQDRAAQIIGVDWVYADDTPDNRKNFERIEAAVSLESPIGPWIPLGEMAIDPLTFDGSLQLPEPTWARFVRITAHKNPHKGTTQAPGQILVYERPGDSEYFSVLGEWGTTSQRAFYELQQGLQPEAALVAVDNTSRARAADLEPGASARGLVSLGKQEHWYKLAVPSGQNTLKIVMRGDPSVRTVVNLEDAARESIPVRRIDQKMTPSEHEFEAVVEPGSNVWFRVAEPPRNVVFSWDTSASVGPYIPIINNSIVAFSGQVVPGQETVNLFPFPSGPLLRDWLSEPYMLQTILNDYRRPSSSSAAEVTLKRATTALGPMPGTKAIVVITDGDVNHDGYLWGEYQKTQPRVFSLQVSGAERIHLQLLRDWSTVNGGHFSQLLYDGEMEVAFDRASTLMHRPAGYTLQVDSEFREAPGPGSLRVAGGEGGAAGAAVELILDASGSMLQRLDGKRRINIAKEVLTEAVREHIPAGTPVALRVFGHKEVDSCRTDLEIKLGPLDPDAAAKKIAGINAMNLARTPIADSLKAVASDLKGAGGGVVVLVTDGEETCDGDPGKAIEALQAQGFAINLNIVGFAIDDAELAAQFMEWAELGGGRYLAANDRDGLSGALESALRVSFTVFDRGGNEVASGEVGGDPVEVEQGVYRVVINSATPRTFDDVDVKSESEVKLELN